MTSKLRRHALLCRFRRHFQSPGRTALILPPARPGSLGDDAMLRATLAMLRDAGFNRIGVLTYDQADRYTNDPDIQHHQLKDFLSYGLEEGLMRFIKHAQGYTHFYLIGADVMDGYYSPKETLAKIVLARLGDRCGLNTTLLGFSFNAHADQDCVDALRTLPGTVVMHARDPVSHRRLSESLGRNVEMSADLAFLLPPNATRPAVMEFLERLNAHKSSGRILLGINVAYLILGTDPSQAQIDTLLRKVKEAILAIVELHPETTFVLFPHDMRGPMSDLILANRLAENLSREMSESQLMLVPSPLDSGEIKALCAPLDAAFTSRMHFGIACLSQGVPIAAVGYQGKFEGLMERFDLTDQLLPDADTLEPDTLITLIERLIKERSNLKRRVLEKLPDIRRLATNNFSNCLPDWGKHPPQTTNDTIQNTASRGDLFN